VGNQEHLLNGASSSLPAFYNKAIDGIEIGTGVGSCGTAAFTGERVIVDDIQNHPY
jgi:putative methionine-R-sulfoxide reductase with GAF domain